MEEGTFVQWLKAPGDYVTVGEAIYLLEGEKAAQEIESIDAGILCVPSDAPQPGSPVRVGEVVGFLLSDSEQPPTTVGNQLSSFTAQPLAPASSFTSPTTSSSSTSSLLISKAAPVAPATSRNPIHFPTSRVAGPAARRLARELGIDLSTVPTPDPTGRVLSGDLQQATGQCGEDVLMNSNTLRVNATPRARRTARQLGIDWTQLEGSGRSGRIRERDIISNHHQENPNSAHNPFQEIPPTEPGSYQAASKLRQSIAQRMSAGVHQAVPVTLTTKVDARSLVAYRERLKKMLSADEPTPSYNDILIYLVAQTLREQPELNACWYRGGIHTYSAIHIATAVDTANGLLAPVVPHADQMSVMNIAKTTRQLIDQAQAGRLTQNQLTGATFTVSNLGMFGVDAFTPILNLPQAAILGIGRIVQEPVVREGRVEVGETLSLSLTFDHRVTDGAPAARWLQSLSQRIASLQD
jgi:pyruvate dehydrogenase E2 component (dihydrolipoamide acetyltransferase)